MWVFHFWLIKVKCFSLHGSLVDKHTMIMKEIFKVELTIVMW
jgi:hypothetical protein